MAKIATPELDKVKTVRDENRAISKFLDWLLTNNYVICNESNYDGTYNKIELSFQQLIAAYFGIDLNKVAQEKEVIYEDYINSGT